MSLRLKFPTSALTPQDQINFLMQILRIQFEEMELMKQEMTILVAKQASYADWDLYHKQRQEINKLHHRVALLRQHCQIEFTEPVGRFND